MIMRRGLFRPSRQIRINGRRYAEKTDASFGLHEKVRVFKMLLHVFHIFGCQAAQVAPLLGITQTAQEKVPCDCIFNFGNRPIQGQPLQFSFVVAN